MKTCPGRWVHSRESKAVSLYSSRGNLLKQKDTMFKCGTGERKPNDKWWQEKKIKKKTGWIKRRHWLVLLESLLDAPPSRRSSNSLWRDEYSRWDIEKGIVSLALFNYANLGFTLEPLWDLDCSCVKAFTGVSSPGKIRSQLV